jgi:Ca2+-binding RTX toxin-like protein
LVATGTNDTVAAISGTSPMTVEGGSGTAVVFVNDDTSSVPSSIFLGGAANYVSENTSVSSAVVNVGGSSVPATDPSNTGKGGAYIEGNQGFTTVNLYTNAWVHLDTGSVAAGGHNVFVAQSGTDEVLGIGGSSTVPVTISALAGSNLLIQNDDVVFIAPGAGNIELSAGLTNNGQATLYGGTGSDTVFGGGNGGNQENGYFQGGSGGNNIIVSSTVSGATTIVGGGNNNLLGSFANNDLVVASSVAGAGNNDTLAAWDSVTGDTLIGGAGTNTIFGSGGGNTFIGFGSGSAVATGYTGDNTYFQAYAGGLDTIKDFLPGSDAFSLTLSAQYEGVGSITIGNISNFGVSGSQVTLSDGSTIDFINTKVTGSNFT